MNCPANQLFCLSATLKGNIELSVNYLLDDNNNNVCIITLLYFNIIQFWIYYQKWQRKALKVITSSRSVQHLPSVPSLAPQTSQLTWDTWGLVLLPFTVVIQSSVTVRLFLVCKMVTTLSLHHIIIMWIKNISINLKFSVLEQFLLGTGILGAMKMHAPPSMSVSVLYLLLELEGYIIYLLTLALNRSHQIGTESLSV